jgi:hypothetical protein
VSYIPPKADDRIKPQALLNVPSVPRRTVFQLMLAHNNIRATAVAVLR